MYISPIEIISEQIRTETENEVFKAVQRVNINVDKQELIKALAYDRNQYAKGFKDAEERFVIHAHWIIRGRKIECSNCKHRKYIGTDEEQLLREEIELNKFCFHCGAIMDEEVIK